MQKNETIAAAKSLQKHKNMEQVEEQIANRTPGNSVKYRETSTT